MSYQQGTNILTQGVTTVNVVFPESFSDAPELILVSVSVAGEVNPTAVTGMVTEKTAEGFSCKLSPAVPTSNYTISWIAGAVNTLTMVLAHLGTKISDTPLRTSLPDVNDYLAMVSVAGVPTTEHIKWGTIYGFFGKLVGSPPAAPTTPGNAGDWSVDSKYFYSHDGVTWGRTPRVISHWDFGVDPELVQTGVTYLTQGVNNKSIVFDVPFNTTPEITFSIENTSVGTKQFLVGLITAKSVNGFSILLNATPNNSRYAVSWRAVGQPQA